MGISADIRGLDPSDLLGQPHWDRIAAYSQRWAESLANHPPHSISEQERLLNGHLAWQNWGGTLPPAPLGRLLVPQTFGRVAAAVCAAAAAGRRVRAVGKGHTWTPMFFDADGAQRKRSTSAAYSSGCDCWRAVAADLGHAAVPSDVVLDSVRHGHPSPMGT
ncbi:hypothetical protein WJX81_008283 [Elliptochloris bilobata]|uniref:Uncharacterized protein n=1 Tax=Elliptochloris bilobata TaxID=381761 RepID=A0AAW1RTH6_9CHLO